MRHLSFFRIACTSTLLSPFACAAEPAGQQGSEREHVDPAGAQDDDDEDGEGQSERDASTRDGGKQRDARARPEPTDEKADAGAQPPSDEARCGAVRAEAKLERKPVDIILALDTSGSMAPQICNVSTNLTSFAKAVSENGRVVSLYQMGLLGLFTEALCGSADPLAQTPLAMDKARYLNVPIMVDSFNALTQISAQYDSYRPFLRPDAATHMIVVSDDESDPTFGGMLATDFQAEMDEKLGRPYVFHSIVADGQNNCLGSRVGTQYLALSDSTKGQKLSICAQDWSALFERLQEAIVSTTTIPCDFEIPAPPAGEQLDADAVQVVFGKEGAVEEQFPRSPGAAQCGDAKAWHYDDEQRPKRIELCPAACDAVKESGKVDIAFGCAPVFVQ